MSLLSRIVSYWLEGIASVMWLAGVIFYCWRFGFTTKYKFVIGFLTGVSILAIEISTKTGVSNSLQYSLIYLLNSLCWSIFFFFQLNSKLKRNLAISTALITLSYFIYKNIVLEFDLIFDSLGQVISSVGIVLLVFVYFHQVLSEVKKDSLTQNFDFWLSSSQLVYHLGAFGIFLTFDHFTSKILNTQHYSDENRQILSYLWGVHNVLLFLASLLTWVGVLWIVYRRKSQTY